MRARWFFGVWVLAAAAPAIAANPDLCAHRPEAVRFTDVAVPAGIGGDLYHASTHHGLGLIWIDYDDDSRPDLFAVNGYGYLPHLFHNLGDGTFERADDLLPDLPPIEMTAATFADYDNDGDRDIYISTDSDEFAGIQEVNAPDGFPNLLLQNRFVENGGRVIDGEPLFRDVAEEAGVADLPTEPFGPRGGFRDMSSAWLDVDRDGWVDLYCAHWVPHLYPHLGNRDRMYRNRGDGTFEDATESFGVDPTFNEHLWRSELAVIGAHLDGDLWPDLYLGGGGGGIEPAPRYYDQLLLNDGRGVLVDATARSPGVGNDSKAAMGLAVADIDLDGDWDILVANQKFLPSSQGNVLYLGNGDGTFADNSAGAAGILGGYSTWGVNFLDADQDGYEDLFSVEDMFRDYFYVNDCDGTFTLVRSAAGLPDTERTRGSAVADYDGDGDIDIAFVDNDGFLHLLRNDTVGGHWLRVELRATVSNRAAIGAVVQARVGDQLLMRQVIGGSSAHSQNELAVHFGVGKAERVDSLRVLWPSGLESDLTDVPVDTVLTITEVAPTATATVTASPSATSPPPTETATAVPTSTPTPSPTIPVVACHGDCDGDQQVTVNELILGVQIALGVVPLSDCPALDADADKLATVSDLVRAVNRALSGCPPTNSFGVSPSRAE